MGELYRLDFPNGKSYIGITTGKASKRLCGHSAACSKGKDTILYNAWRKHGKPSITVIAILENSELASTEIRAIKVFKTLKPNGYNLLEGGQVSPMTTPEVAAKLKGNTHTLGMKFPAENYPARKEFYDFRKGKSVSDSHRAGMVAAQNKPEAKERVAARMRGKSNPMKDPVVAAKQGAKMKGKKQTAEHTAKCKESITNAWKDPAFRDNQIAKRRGKKHSEETISKMKVAQQLRREKERQNG